MSFQHAFEKAMNLVREKTEAAHISVRAQPPGIDFSLSLCPTSLCSFLLCILEHIWKLIGYSVYNVVFAEL